MPPAPKSGPYRQLVPMLAVPARNALIGDLSRQARDQSDDQRLGFWIDAHPVMGRE